MAQEATPHCVALPTGSAAVSVWVVCEGMWSPVPEVCPPPLLMVCAHVGKGAPRF